MTAEVAIVLRLKAAAAVAAIVGTRVHQVKLPQSPVLPAVRVQVISEPTGYHLRGEDGTTRSRVQVDAFVAETGDAYASVTALAAAIHAALSGKRFTVSDGASPADGLEVTGVFRLDRRALYDAAELRLLRIQQDYAVWWK